MLPQAVNICVRWKARGLEAQILLLEDKGMRLGGREEHLAVICAHNRKGERGGRVLKLDVGLV